MQVETTFFNQIRKAIDRYSQKINSAYLF